MAAPQVIHEAVRVNRRLQVWHCSERPAQSDSLFQVCELAAIFAGLTATVSTLDDRSMSPLRRSLDPAGRRQMFELSLLAIAAGLFPELLRRPGVPARVRGCPGGHLRRSGAPSPWILGRAYWCGSTRRIFHGA